MALQIIGQGLATLWRHRVIVVSVVTPLALLPLVILSNTLEAKAAYVIVLMSFYWNFEVLPLGVTALIPVLLVPLLGIIPSSELCPAYFKDSNMLFLGGLIMAVSIEAWGLHRRIALRVLLLFGVQPKWLLSGFLLPTYLLSMWISNTATTAMMLPIAEAVLQELRMQYEKHNDGNGASVNAAYSSSSADGENGACDNAAYSSSSADENNTPSSSTDGEDNGLKKDGVLQNGDKELPAASTSVLCASEDEEKEHKQTILANLSMKEFISKKENAEFAGISKMLMLSIAYGAVFGGVATITGTSPNVILNGIIQEYFGSETSFNYSSWLFYALPFSVVCLLISWVWLQISFLGFRSFYCKSNFKNSSEQESIKLKLRKQYDDLGSITFAEVEVLILFLITIIFWVSREPGSPGWGQLFRWQNRKTGKMASYASDAQPAILAAIAMFFLPSENPFRCRSTPAASVIEEAVTADGIKIQVTKTKPNRLLTWQLAQEKVAWHIVLMLGSGLALAETSRQSGLSDWIGSQLTEIGSVPLGGLVFLFCFCSTILTELTSNGAAATIVLPILASFSQRVGLHPFYMMLSSTASCSFAFILPISTPANIMVYSRGYLSPLDMMRTGVVMTIISNSIVAGATLAYAPGIFGLSTFPSWASQKSSNATLAG